jgi:hypothetical protein
MPWRPSPPLFSGSSTLWTRWVAGRSRGRFTHHRIRRSVLSVVVLLSALPASINGPSEVTAQMTAPRAGGPIALLMLTKQDDSDVRRDRASVMIAPQGVITAVVADDMLGLKNLIGLDLLKVEQRQLVDRLI